MRTPLLSLSLVATMLLLSVSPCAAQELPDPRALVAKARAELEKDIVKGQPKAEGLLRAAVKTWEATLETTMIDYPDALLALTLVALGNRKNPNRSALSRRPPSNSMKRNRVRQG